jgi:hypothetical protein
MERKEKKLQKNKMWFYEGNDETTISGQCWRDGADVDELVRNVPEGAGRDGVEARHEGIAAPHCPIHCRKVLY